MIISLSHFYTLFVGFRENDDFEFFYLDLELLCCGSVLEALGMIICVFSVNFEGWVSINGAGS